MSFFFFSSRRRHTRSLCDWSSDVCSSDLLGQVTFVETYWYQLAGMGPLPAIDTARLDWKQWLGQIGRASCRKECRCRWTTYHAEEMTSTTRKMYAAYADGTTA